MIGECISCTNWKLSVIDILYWIVLILKVEGHFTGKYWYKTSSQAWEWLELMMMIRHKYLARGYSNHMMPSGDTSSCPTHSLGSRIISSIMPQKSFAKPALVATFNITMTCIPITNSIHCVAHALNVSLKN